MKAVRQPQRKNTLFDWTVGEPLGEVEFRGPIVYVRNWNNPEYTRQEWSEILNQGWGCWGSTWINDYCPRPVMQYF